jgi:hypothetical protein
MTRTHRQWHLAMWLVIAPSLLLGLAAGVLLRPGRAGPAPAPAPFQESRP